MEHKGVLKKSKNNIEYKKILNIFNFTCRVLNATCYMLHAI